MIDVPVRVKDALRDGRRLKEYRFNVLNDDDTTDFTIDNDYLVSETVKFDERMCSDETIKFGLCEGTSLEFQYFNKDNINGRQIQAFVDVQYEDANGDLQWYTIPMGFYTVKQCPMQFSTGIRKVTAYNKLMSDYLDAKANSLLEEAYTEISSTGYCSTVSIGILLSSALEAYAVNDRKEYDVEIVNTAAETSVDTVTYQTSWGDFGYSYVVRVRLNITDLSAFTNDVLQGYTQAIFSNVQAFKAAEGIVEEGLKNYYYVTLHSGSSGVAYSCDLYDYTDDEITTPIVQDVEEGTDTNDYIITITAPSSKPLGKTEEDAAQEIIDIIESTLNIKVYVKDDSDNIGGMSFADVTALSDVTLRELQSAVFETQCQYGKLDRTTDLFAGVSLGGSHLYPADDLYPADSLYPEGTSEHGLASSYSKLWTDSGGTQSFRYLIITYKDSDGNDATLQRTVNASGTTDYNMSDNWLFRNLNWSAADVGTYADAMATLMQDVEWFPFEMWAAGLPYLETGDEIEITNSEGTYTSYILQRQLQGIQNLQDTFINGILDIF